MLIRYRRTFPFPVGEAYAWLTDYQDDDPARTGAIVKERPVLSRSENQVVLRGVLETLGRRWEGNAVVDLMPPDRWRATTRDARGRVRSVYDYRLEPADGGRASLLTVDYRFNVRRWRTRLTLLVARRAIVKEIDRMWDGFAAAMQRELRPGATVAPTAA